MAVALQKKKMDTIEAEINMVGEFIEETIVNLEVKLMNIKEVRDCFDHVAKLYGLIENVQEIIDMIEPLNDEHKQKRRCLTELTEIYTTKLLDLSQKVDDKKKALAETKKNLGNEAFKNGQYPQALLLYTEAINADQTNPLCFTNRALVHQKMNKWEEALLDAKYAVELDADMLKAYIIVIKCQIKLLRVADMEKTVASVPIAHQKRPELLEQKVLGAALAKDLGNNCLKEGDVDGAVVHYGIAIGMDETNHIYYSNRSAAYQQKKQWKDAATDAEMVVKLNGTFPKGYLHLSRSLIQLQKFKEALGVVEKAKIQLAKCGELTGIQAQLEEISAQISAGLSGYATSATRRAEVNDTARAEAFKVKGNESYKEGEYQDAVRFYSQAIAAVPGEGSYYGNRAAAWVMLKEFKKAAEDCAEGLKLEKKVGELDKLRLRHANALAQLGRMDEAIVMLESIVDGGGSAVKNTSSVFSFDRNSTNKQSPSSNSQNGKNDGKKTTGNKRRASYDRESDDDSDEDDEDDDDEDEDEEDSVPVRSDKEIAPFKEQLQNLRTAKANVALAQESLTKREFSRAKRLAAIAQTGGLADDPTVRLVAAKAMLGLGELEDCSREAQKVIAACGPGGTGGCGLSSIAASGLLLEAYVVRGDALHGLGITDQAQKYFAAALQLDPDNQEVGRKLKTLRRVVTETARLRGEIDKAMVSRKFEAVIGFCTEGLTIDKDSKKLMTEMHLKRARAYQSMAKHQLRLAQSAPSSSSAKPSSGTSGTTPASPSVYAEDYLERSKASWRKCLSDSTSVLYYDNDSTDGVTGCCLKADAMLGLERFEDTVAELEQYIASMKGKGVDLDDVKEKLDEAKMLLKKSKRKDLYAVLGVTKGALATTAEIKTAYKKSALKWHPDRHSGGTEEKKKEAETKFKEISDTFELLTDPVKKKLYDQGYERDEIDQRAEYQTQGGGRGHGHSHGGFGGFSGFGGFH